MKYREIGPNLYNDYVQSGLLTIDNFNPSDPQISSLGELEILDDEVALLHFDFERIHKIDARPIYEMYNDESLIAKYQVVGDTNCTESYIIWDHSASNMTHRLQTFNWYLVEKPILSLGSLHQTVVLASLAWGHTLRLMLQNGELHFQFSENTGKFQLAEKKMLADDQWHHIAVVMPFNSCRYSEVQLYIDGVLCKTQQTHGSDNHMFFHTSGKLNIGGYGYRKDFDNDDGLLHMFEGAVDDVMVWSKPLQKQDILRLWDDEHQCEDDTECCGSCLNGKCEGESESRPQDQGVQSLNNGLDAPILTGGPLSSSAHLNLYWIFNPMSISFIVGVTFWEV